MLINQKNHLGYSTNIHRGNTWEETFTGLKNYTMRVREHVCAANELYGIGLRLSNQASLDLNQPETIAEFRKWLDQNNCYVFTVNGFPYGNFHGTRVKEQVYLPDWQSNERVDYTNRLFSLLVELLPSGAEGSVSTLPCSFKPFIGDDEHALDRICKNLERCAQYIDDLSERYDRDLHLGLEPEPFGFIENTEETIQFFDLLRSKSSATESVLRRIGINYDTCHMAIQFEDAQESLSRLVENEIRLSKIHLSSALKIVPNPHTRSKVRAFMDPVYLHQVVAQTRTGELRRWLDLDEAMKAPAEGFEEETEWRIHFHIPLYTAPGNELSSTADHLEDTLKFLQRNPDLCNHYEFETYTWEVLPTDMRADSVIEQLVAEYEWCFKAMEVEADVSNSLVS